MEHFRYILGKEVEGNKKRRERKEEQEKQVRKKSAEVTEWIPEWEVDFNEEEVRNMIRIKRNNVPGEDKLIVEFFKETPNEVHRD